MPEIIESMDFPKDILKGFHRRELDRFRGKVEDDARARPDHEVDQILVPLASVYKFPADPTDPVYLAMYDRAREIVMAHIDGSLKERYGLKNGAAGP